jgi:hypothetical protein
MYQMQQLPAPGPPIPIPVQLPAQPVYIQQQPTPIQLPAVPDPSVSIQQPIYIPPIVSQLPVVQAPPPIAVQLPAIPQQLPVQPIYIQQLPTAPTDPVNIQQPIYIPTVPAVPAPPIVSQLPVVQAPPPIASQVPIVQIPPPVQALPASPKKTVMVLCRPLTPDEQKILTNNFKNIVNYHATLSSTFDLTQMSFDLLIVDKTVKANHFFLEMIVPSCKTLNIPIVVVGRNNSNDKKLASAIGATIIKKVKKLEGSDFFVFLSKTSLPKLEHRLFTAIKKFFSQLSK